MTNTDKMTNKKALNYILNTYGEDIPLDVKEKVESMIAAIDKKSSTERKPSARQLKNEEVKEAIVANMVEDRLYGINDMLKEFDCFTDETSSQYVSSLLSQLIKENKVVRVLDKRKAYFTLA